MWADTTHLLAVRGYDADVFLLDLGPSGTLLIDKPAHILHDQADLMGIEEGWRIGLLHVLPNDAMEYHGHVLVGQPLPATHPMGQLTLTACLQ